MNAAALKIGLRPLLLILALTTSLPAAQSAATLERDTSLSSVASGTRAFPLSQIRLLEGPFKQARDLNRKYLLAHDINRLLAPFRIEAGLQPKAPKYSNWENIGLDGHTAGHYLTALAQMWADSGDVEMKQRLDTMIEELAECQKAQPDAYLGGIPRGRELWTAVASANMNFQSFSLNGAWVPWYNEHKLFAGLRDAYLVGGNTQARDVLIRLADWCDTLVSRLTEEQMQGMLKAEHGGMNEVLADVYAITGNQKYLALAQRFSHRATLDPLLRHEDKLTGLHANTQIPKVIGFSRIAELGGDASWRDAARFFWDTVTEHRSVAFGGNSEREHFNAANNFATLIESREGPETCNTYNMLRLTESLFRSEPAAHYADYYERALYNHILSSQHPGHGGYVYFTPIRPQHYRVYSQPEQCFWCCVGTGMENHGKYGAFIYAHTEEALFVNLFIASELDWKERGIVLRQETHFPDSESTRLVLKTSKPQRFTLQVRHPGWVSQEALKIRVNGELQKVQSSPSSYVPLTRVWKEGDCIELELPMRTTLERLPDGSDYVAVLRGPIVLAAKTGTERLDGLLAGDSRSGHISSGPYLALDQAPMLVGDYDRLAEHLQAVPGKALSFTAPELIRPKAFQQLELIPFFRVHDARYVLYWRTVSREKYPALAAALEASEKARLTLEALTIDQVSPGEQQPEVDHEFKGEGSEAGVNQGRHWRDASAWFSYKMKNSTAAPLELFLTYYADERGREFEILVNDQPIATVTLKGGQRDRFIDVRYPIPPEITQAAGTGFLVVKFAAKGKSRAGAVYDVRLMKTALAEPQAVK